MQILVTLSLIAAQGVIGAVIDHDHVHFIPEAFKTPAVKNYQPQLKVFEGCVPFPAVNAYGDVSGGLGITYLSSPELGCAHAKGQVYARTGTHNGQFAIMYAWFFPKAAERSFFGTYGQRYEWEHMVLWFRTEEDSRSGHPYVLAYTDSGKWLFDTQWAIHSGHPVVGKVYLRLETDVNGGAGYQPLIEWDMMPRAAQAALNNFSFHSKGTRDDLPLTQECWLNKPNFEAQLGRAWMSPP